MTARLLPALALLAALVPAGAAPAAPGAATAQDERRCRSTDRFITDIRAQRLRCSSARRVALRWARTDACFRETTAGRVVTRPCRVRGGWSCTPGRSRLGARVRCRTRDPERELRFTSTVVRPDPHRSSLRG